MAIDCALYGLLVIALSAWFIICWAIVSRINWYYRDGADPLKALIRPVQGISKAIVKDSKTAEQALREEIERVMAQNTDIS